MLNETHLFVAAGFNGVENSPTNYFLDINTEQWTRLANRTFTKEDHHTSGTFLNTTVGEIQIANIGSEGIEVYSPQNNLWHQVSFPPPLTSLRLAAKIQQEIDSFIIIGGYSNLEDSSGDIYTFDENGLSVLQENALRTPRSGHVAMPISKNDFICNDE